MSKVKFDLCPFADSSGFKFKDLTGQQPTDTDGYPVGADLTLYVGTVKWIGSGDVLLHSEIVDVNTSGVFQVVLLDIPDGMYEVSYTVIDDQGTQVGECTLPVIIDKVYRSNVNSLLAEANKCTKCRSEILDSLNRAKSFVDAASTLARGQDMAGSHKMWAEAMKVIELQNCKC